MSLFRLEGIPEDFFLLCALLFQLSQSCLNALFRQHKLCSRENADALQLLNGTLAQNVKASDGVHLIPPQFNTVGVLLRQIKHIHDTSADGKLSGTFHLVSLLIAHLHQTFCKSPLVQAASSGHPDHVLLLPEHLRCHQSSIGCHDGHRLALHDPAQSADTLLYQLIAVNVCLKEDQILGRIQHDISVIKFIFLVKLFCF